MKNFFEHQETAQRNTRNLILLMTLGVIAMGLAIYVLMVILQRFLPMTSASVLMEFRWFQPELLLGTLLGTALIVGIASASRLVFLRGGGSKVAEMLGGRLVSGSPQDLLEKRFLNVLEEMSIASGMPVPQAFVLDNEAGINAFAAGQTTHDAVVAVSRGCLEKLTRTELQGVVAHEMSHITHGDMRINTRLMGIVFGIVCIALLGRLLLRFGGTAGAVRRRSNQDSSRLALVLFGVGLLAIGSLGELFGKLIKSAVGRQREFLADASAVQFTRDPTGIAGALKKIGGFSHGSRIESARAEEASHMFFSDIHAHLAGLFATHPPLTERITRIDPGFDGTMPTVGEGIAQPEEISSFAGGAGVSQMAAADVVASVGTVSADAVQSAQAWLTGLPMALRDGARDGFSATAISYAMLWSSEERFAHVQRELIQSMLGSAWLEAVDGYVPLLRRVSRSHCIALAELLAPALRTLSPDQRHRSLEVVRGLIAADQKVSLFEHLLSETLSATLMSNSVRPQPRRLSLALAKNEIEFLLSLLAQAGAATHHEVDASFAQASARLPELHLQLLAPAPGQLKGLSHCLSTLRALAPSGSSRVLDAMAHGALANNKVNDAEAMLVAATCLALEIPLPAWA